MADKRSDPESVIGIDLGTTYSCVGVCRLVNGEYKVEIIANEMGNRTTPSYVSFNEEGQRLIGDAAKDQLVRNLKETVFNIKRMIGRKWTDRVVQKEIKKFPFEVIGNDLSPVVKIVTKKKKARQFSPEQISAMILKRMAKLACNFANEDINNVVITVPAYFNDAQRQATKNAGIIAGLNVLRIINEPTAAAIAYGLNSVEDEKIILVYDLGGGTFDVTILKIIQKRFTVLATCGDPYLGGEDFDQNVIDYFVKMYEMKTKTTISENHRAIQRLRKEIEKAKKVLTHSTQTSIEIDSFFEGNDFSETLTRAKFESLNMELFKSTLKSVKQALDDAKLTKENVDEIVMIGGSSRIPKIRELVKEFFDGKEPCQKINPDEAVAYGAAVQAAILTNKDSSVVLNDVNPLSLGIDVSSKMKVIIPRNTTIPVTQSTLLSTVADFQKRAKFVIYEGELPVAKDNLRIGELTLFNIQKSTAGVPHLKLTFEIDDNGILHVSAEDQVTKEKKEISISYEENRPSQEQIEEMIKISEEYDNLDDKYNQVVNLRIELSEAVYTLQQGLESMGLTERKKKQLEEISEENLQWLNDNKICEIEDMKIKKRKFDENVKATLRSKN